MTSAVAKITIKELLRIIKKKNPTYAFTRLKTVFLRHHADEETAFRQQCELLPEDTAPYTNIYDITNNAHILWHV